jgi:hypothetical protein
MTEMTDGKAFEAFEASVQTFGGPAGCAARQAMRDIRAEIRAAQVVCGDRGLPVSSVLEVAALIGDRFTFYLAEAAVEEDDGEDDGEDGEGEDGREDWQR